MSLENHIAATLLRGFQAYQDEFTAITRGAADRFISAGWHAVQGMSRERILLYKSSKAQVCALVAEDARYADWAEVKSRFTAMLAGRDDPELAGTFFNTIYRVVGPDTLLSDRHTFVDHDPPLPTDQVDLTRSHEGENLQDLLASMLADTELASCLTGAEADLAVACERLRSEIPLLRQPGRLRLETVKAVFYRNKGAYIVGSLSVQEHLFPLTIALCHRHDGVGLDALLWGENRLSVVFSFTRSYFMVDLPAPGALVTYLQTLLPEKKAWELYTSLGYYKHGKTGFFRGLRKNLAETSDAFRTAEGIRGQVMLVFTLDSYRTVFKIIKDRFPATKSVTPDDVRAAYQLVKTHDRVGRMADTQEWHQLRLPKDRFDAGLLAELQTHAVSKVRIEGSEVVISHLYTERLMTPLNLYIKSCSNFQRGQVLEDYGNAIRELAEANIFPGDMLLKNFGVTRHGRVVFYDYDEICYLTEVVFRDLPETPGGQVSAEPWFDVGEYDVFPAEFANFLFPDSDMRALFEAHHADLFTASGWQAIQDRVRADQLTDVYPYPRRERLHDDMR